MEVLSLQYKLNVNNFKYYLENTNKTFGSASSSTVRVYFNPIKLGRIIGVVHYCNQALYAYHLIPNIDLITAKLATNYGTVYGTMQSLTSDKDNDDDDFVKFPTLEAKTWTDWNDKFILKLQGVMGNHGFSL